jgi:hypothetical protein
MDRPSIGARATETITSQIGAFTDPHAGVTHQEEGVRA